MRDKIKLNKVKISYPSLFEARYQSQNPGESDDKYYDCTFILDKDIHAAEIKTIKEKIAELFKEKKFNSGARSPLRDGDLDPKEREEYKNSYVLKAKEKRRPPVISKDGRTMLTEDDNLLDGGGYVVLAYISLYAYTKGSSGVSANLIGVQHLGGEPFVPKDELNIEEMFEPVEEDEDFPFG